MLSDKEQSNDLVKYLEKLQCSGKYSYCQTESNTFKFLPEFLFYFFFDIRQSIVTFEDFFLLKSELHILH